MQIIKKIKNYIWRYWIFSADSPSFLLLQFGQINFEEGIDESALIF